MSNTLNINSQVELQSSISELLSFEKDVKYPKRKFQYNSVIDIETEKKIVDDNNNKYQEICQSINSKVPVNTWIKVDIDGIEQGFIRLDCKTPLGYINGYFLRKWQSRMLYYQNFAQIAQLTKFYKENKFVILIGSLLALVMFLVILF